jgi:hypothetical protein
MGKKVVMSVGVRLIGLKLGIKMIPQMASHWAIKDRDKRIRPLYVGLVQSLRRRFGHNRPQYFWCNKTADVQTLIGMAWPLVFIRLTAEKQEKHGSTRWTNPLRPLDPVGGPFELN